MPRNDLYKELLLASAKARHETKPAILKGTQQYKEAAMTEPPDSTLQTLDSVIETVLSLLQQLETTLAAISNGKDEQAKLYKNDILTEAIDPIALTHDTASLVKAHSTKISLLIINEPFTPSAITKVLRELVSGPIPAIAAAVEACDAKRYTKDFRQAIAWKCLSVLRELKALVENIPRDGKVLSKEQKGRPGKGSMATTGLVWEACDEAMKFSRGGVQAFFSREVEEVKNVLKDTMEELKEWGEETEGDSDEEDEEDEEDDEDAADIDSGIDIHDSRANSPGSSQVSVQAMLDNLMNSHKIIPRGDPDGIRPRLETCLRRLRLCMLLCQAIVKRRINRLPTIPTTDYDVVGILEALLSKLKGLPGKFEDLALAFYDLQAGLIDVEMTACVNQATKASKVLSKAWDGGKDEYTEWAEKFELQVNK